MSGSRAQFGDAFVVPCRLDGLLLCLFAPALCQSVDALVVLNLAGNKLLLFEQLLETVYGACNQAIARATTWV